MEKVISFVQEKKLIFAIALTSIIAITFFGLYMEKTTASEKFTCPKMITESEEEETITVDIKGEIKKPGVYKVKQGTIVNEVVKLAGGLTKNADTTNLNLGKKVTDEMVITVYSKEEAKKTTKNNAIQESFTSKTSGNVSLNTATIEELTTLPGIGEAKAKIIIEYRETCGPFTKKEELKNIKGIGEAIYAKLEKYITI